MTEKPTRERPEDELSDGAIRDAIRRTENGIRLHDQHCAWCDCEEFVAVRYGSLHHLSERAARAVKAVVAVVDNPCCPECGSPEKRGGCVTCADGW